MYDSKSYFEVETFFLRRDHFHLLQMTHRTNIKSVSIVDKKKKKPVGLLTLVRTVSYILTE